jgi:hypothetical protein
VQQIADTLTADEVGRAERPERQLARSIPACTRSPKGGRVNTTSAAVVEHPSLGLLASIRR